ncbi:hypothetical protein, partial [Neisseria sicca]|uniref:hypothetical protein n=1 Tax=Neisseria sicca TaxID=490 RepID=UPI001C99F8B7
EGLDGVDMVCGKIGEEREHECWADKGGRNGGVDDVFDVLEEMNGEDGGRNGGSMGKGGDFVGKEGGGNNRAWR